MGTPTALLPFSYVIELLISAEQSLLLHLFSFFIWVLLWLSIGVVLKGGVEILNNSVMTRLSLAMKWMDCIVLLQSIRLLSWINNSVVW